MRVCGKKRVGKLKVIFEGWKLRLNAAQRKKESPSTLAYGSLVTEYCYAHRMWRWCRGFEHKPEKPVLFDYTESNQIPGGKARKRWLGD